MTDLTVIIVIFNSADQLSACAAALEPALMGLAARIVIVDNASSDGSVDVARTLWPAAMTIANPVNRGFGPAVNQGLAVADGRAVLLLNPDARPGAAAVRRLLDYLDGDPTAGIVAPQLLDGAGRPVLSCYPFPTLGTLAWRYLHFHRLAPHLGGGRWRRATLAPNATAPLPVPWAQGACLLLRADMLSQIGGFDERFIFFAEEVDLAWRVATDGWRCVYLPTATVRHQEGTSTGRVPRFKLVSHYFSAVLLFEKHRPSQVRALTALFLIDLALRWLARLPAVLTGRPPDAAERRAAYTTVARSLLRDSPAQRQARWQALAVAATPRR